MPLYPAGAMALRDQALAAQRDAQVLLLSNWAGPDGPPPTPPAAQRLMEAARVSSPGLCWHLSSEPLTPGLVAWLAWEPGALMCRDCAAGSIARTALDDGDRCDGCCATDPPGGARFWLAEMLPVQVFTARGRPGGFGPVVAHFMFCPDCLTEGEA